MGDTMNNEAVKPTEQNPQGYGPKKPEILNLAKATDLFDTQENELGTLNDSAGDGNRSKIVEQFYVQRIARLFMNKVMPPISKWDGTNDMLVSLPDKEWLDAINCYRRRICALLEKVQEQPELFGMTCYRIEDDIHEEEIKSQKSFSRLPLLLVAMAQEGHIQEDGSLFCPCEVLKSAEITKIEALLTGLDVIGWSVIRKDNNVILYDQDCPYVFHILKAFAANGGYDAVLSADSRWLKSEAFSFTVEDFIRLIPAAHIKAFIRDVCDHHMELGYCVKVEYGRYTSRILISKTKSSKELITMNVETDGRYTLALRLSNIADYAHELHGLSPIVLERTLAGHNCGGCGFCKGPICFTYQGNSYRKCSILYNGFVYTDPKVEDIQSIWQLMAFQWDHIRLKLNY